MRAEVALVELHALDEFDFGGEALAFFNGDYAVLADLVHRLGDDLADVGVLVGGAGADLSDLLARIDLLAHLGEFVNDDGHGLVDAALDHVGVRAAGDDLQALAVDGLGVDCGGGGAVPRVLAGFLRDFLDHLGAEVLVLVFQLDFLGDGHAVLGDGG